MAVNDNSDDPRPDDAAPHVAKTTPQPRLSVQSVVEQARAIAQNEMRLGGPENSAIRLLCMALLELDSRQATTELLVEQQRELLELALGSPSTRARRASAAPAVGTEPSVLHGNREDAAGVASPQGAHPSTGPDVSVSSANKDTDDGQ